MNLRCDRMTNQADINVRPSSNTCRTNSTWPLELQHQMENAKVVLMAEPPKAFATRLDESHGEGTWRMLASGESLKNFGRFT